MPTSKHLHERIPLFLTVLKYSIILCTKACLEIHIAKSNFQTRSKAKEKGITDNPVNYADFSIDI